MIILEKNINIIKEITMADKDEMYKQFGKLPLAKDSKTDTSTFLKRRLTLSGVKSKDSKLSSETSDFLKRRLTLSGPKSASVLTKVIKKSPIGKAVDTVIKVGAGVGAGYEYAKSKFKKDDEVEKEEVEKKSSGGMIIGKGKDYIKDLL